MDAIGTRKADRVRNAARRPLGLTLPELLVTIASVSVAMTVTLPSVARYRESARLVTCSSNSSRISKGLLAYDSVQSELPGWRNMMAAGVPIDSTTPSSGNSFAITGYSDGSTSQSTGRRARMKVAVSWAVTALPFMGEQEIFEWFDTFSPDRVADDATRKMIDLYVCPAVATDMKTAAPLCYFVNGGSAAESTDTAGRQYRGDGVCLDAAGNMRTQPWYMTAWGAKDYQPGRSAIADVVDGDGASNTVMLAERTGASSPLDVSWADSPLPATNNGDAVKTAHTILHPGGIHPGYGPPGGGESHHATANTWMKIRNDHGVRYPSSRHEGGFVATFCDGHTKFISHGIDQWVYAQLLSSNPQTMSYRVAMFEKVPTTDGRLVRYMLDDHDLGGQ